MISLARLCFGTGVVSITLAVLAMLPVQEASAADWPQWRGPHRTGRVEAVEPLPGAWPADGPTVLWRAHVGTGFSSLAVAGGRVYTLGNAEDEQTLWCLDAATGEVVWRQSYPEPLDPNLFEGGPTSTPCVSDGAVFSFSRRGRASCCDARTGAIRWQVDVPSVCHVNVPTWGFAASPVVEGDRVLLGAGRAGVALDRASGKVLWASDNEDDAGYATAVMGTWGDQPTALFLSGKSLHAVDPATGRELWEHRWITRYGVNAADPLLDRDRIWLSSGYAKGTALLQVEPDGSGVRELWRMRELRNQMSPGVLVDGSVYAVDGDAGEECQLKCVDFASGEVRWSEPGFGSATLIAVGGRLLILSDAGRLILAEASPDRFHILASHEILTGKCWTPPAFSDGRLYARSAAGEVVAVDLR